LTADDGLGLLARQVRAARLAAGLSIDVAAGAVGMSAVTWGRVEKGLPVRELTYAGVERSLGWRPGFVAGIRAGGAEIMAADESDDAGAEQAHLERIRAVVAELREVQARRDALLDQRHQLAAWLIATGNWSFSALATELGYERTQLAVEFRRRTMQAERRRRQASSD
jgi:transcriptional regulator with XRE-family HTH domain